MAMAVVCVTVIEVYVLPYIANRRSPSPSRNPPSRIVHVEHLTRPFTIMQLKDLLTEEGPMVSNGFWTNKIKSHCIVVVRTLCLLYSIGYM